MTINQIYAVIVIKFSEKNWLTTQNKNGNYNPKWQRLFIDKALAKKEKFLKIFHSTEFFRVSLDAVVVE